MWRCFLFAYCFIVVNIVLFGGLKCLRLSVRKIFVLLSNALKSHLRRSNGKRKWLWAVLRTISSAQKLQAQRFKSACRAIAKKRTPPLRRWYGFWRVFIFVVNRHLLQILRCWLLIANCCRRRHFFVLSFRLQTQSDSVFFGCVVAVATNRTKRCNRSKSQIFSSSWQCTNNQIVISPTYNQCAVIKRLGCWVRQDMRQVLSLRL